MSSILQSFSVKSQSKIYWKQVIALLLLDVSVIISWIAYHEFQPKILENFGLSEMAFPFLIWQALIVIVTPAVAGFIADQQKEKTGKRLPIINFGINVVAMIFMAVAITLFIEPTGWIVWIIPIAVTGWLISMNIFRSPAISLIERFVPQRQLPAVLAIFVFCLEIAYSLEPVIVDLLNFLGAPITFLVGGTLIFTSGIYLKKTFKSVSTIKLDDNAYGTDTKSGKSKFWVVITLSIVLGIYTTLILKFIPNLINDRFGALDLRISGNALATALLIISACFSLLLGRHVNKDNIDVFAVWGILGFSVAFGTLVVFGGGIATLFSILFLTIFFSFLSVSALPLALYELSAKQTIFGIGLFYGFLELGEYGWNILFY